MALSHLVRSYKRLASHTYLQSEYRLFWNQCHAKYMHQWKLNKLLFQCQNFWNNYKKSSFMPVFRLSRDQYLHQKIKNFKNQDKIFFWKHLIFCKFCKFFLNAKNCDNKTNIDFWFILKENIITNICNNEFLKKINKKTPYEGVFLEWVLE